MNKFRIGVVGLARGLSYAKTYATVCEDTELVAVCENSPQKIERAKQELPETVAYYTDFESFIEHGLDAVVLCNFFHEHAKYAIAAMKKGIHVLSETTAAPTLGECVALCEAAESSNAKYMLAANMPNTFGCEDLARLYKGGTFGRVLYAEGEYFHTAAPEDNALHCGGDNHWRNHLPRTYYNMHDLGALMSITRTMPKKVNAKAIFAPDVAREHPDSYVGDVSSVILNEMDNGAIFRTTSCAHLGPSGKWYRLVCENGTIETVRGDQESILYTYNPWSKPEGEELTKTYDARPEVMSEAQKNDGHGGSDYVTAMLFADCLKGMYTPFFNVYRSVALSAAGILAWYSVLEDGKEFLVPDFTDKEQRAAYANDFRTPFPNFADGTGVTLPCSSKPYVKPKW